MCLRNRYRKRSPGWAIPTPSTVFFLYKTPGWGLSIFLPIKMKYPTFLWNSSATLGGQGSTCARYIDRDKPTDFIKIDRWWRVKLLPKLTLITPLNWPSDFFQTRSIVSSIDDENSTPNNLRVGVYRSQGIGHVCRPVQLPRPSAEVFVWLTLAPVQAQNLFNNPPARFPSS